MNILRNEIHIGVEKPFCVLHASDTHLTYADARDGQRKLDLAEGRAKAFPDAEQNYDFLIEKAKSENRPIIYTGDLIDFVSELNLEKASRIVQETDFYMAAGNHEFSLYVGEAFEDEAYRNQSLAKVQSIFKNDIRCSSAQIGGVNFVFIDNSYYLFDRKQLDFLKAETEKALPVILCVHTPLYNRTFYDYERDGKSAPAYLMSVPEELMADYSEHRYRQQKEDAVTHEAYEFIMQCKNIKAILSGHLHKNFVAMLTEGCEQLVTGCGTVREIYID